MIINYSKKDDKEALFISVNKDDCRASKSGKSWNIMLGEKSKVMVEKDGVSKELTLKDLITKLF